MDGGRLGRRERQVGSSSTVRWADNNSFLVRTYQVEVQGEKATSGTMFIGWDPQTGQIKSWIFDSNGGHGEGLWTRTGEKEWVVKAQGVLRDGRPTSATQIHMFLNKDSVKTSSIDRIIGGEIAPDIVDVVMVRKPPQPGAAAPSQATATRNRESSQPRSRSTLWQPLPATDMESRASKSAFTRRKRLPNPSVTEAPIHVEVPCLASTIALLGILLIILGLRWYAPRSARTGRRRTRRWRRRWSRPAGGGGMGRPWAA